MSEILREYVETLLKYKLAEIKSLNLFQTYLDALSYPLYESVVAEEKRFTLQLAINFSKISGLEQEKRVDTYLKKFEWLSFHWFVGTPLTKIQIKNKLSRLATNAEQELSKIKREEQKNEDGVRKIVRKLKFNTEEKLLLKQYRSWLFLRTFVKDSINKAAFKLLPILHAIADAKQIDQKLITFLTLELLRAK